MCSSDLKPTIHCTLQPTQRLLGCRVHALAACRCVSPTSCYAMTGRQGMIKSEEADRAHCTWVSTNVMQAPCACYHWYELPRMHAKNTSYHDLSPRVIGHSETYLQSCECCLSAMLCLSTHFYMNSSQVTSFGCQDFEELFRWGLH